RWSTAADAGDAAAAAPCRCAANPHRRRRERGNGAAEAGRSTRGAQPGTADTRCGCGRACHGAATARTGESHAEPTTTQGTIMKALLWHRTVRAVVTLLLLPAGAQAQALSYADRSGTITTGGTAQVAMPAGSGRHGCMIQNQSAGSLWVSETATAIAGP